MRLKVFGAALLGALLMAAMPARADDYPSRPITVIVPFPPGGSSDIVMRLVASKVAESIKQPIIIENRSGAAGNVAAIAIKKAATDGILVVPAASPAKSVAELVALAKTRPEGLSYGSQGVGTGGHLLGELFAKHAG